jgi:hypothetical protein
MHDLADRISTFRTDAATLRRNGHAAQAASIERVVDGFAGHPIVTDLLTFISEGEAQLRSGMGVDALRKRFPQWAEDGLAELRGRRRFYCRLIVPRRKLNSIVRAEAARSA